MDPERVGRKQAIIAHVPPGGMARVGGMIKNGDPSGLALNRAGAIPLRPFPPVLSSRTPRQDDGPAQAVFAVAQPHRFGHPHRHRAFFGVAENHRFIGRGWRVISKSNIRSESLVELDLPLVRANDCSVGSNPAIARSDQAGFRARGDLQKSFVDRFAYPSPDEIDAVDVAVSEPKSGVLGGPVVPLGPRASASSGSSADPPVRARGNSRDGPPL